MTLEDIARVAHEVNRAYCQALGRNLQRPWELASEDQRRSSYEGVKFHLRSPEAGPEDLHKAWMEQRYKEGWRHGPVKDPKNKTHPCLVPFGDLPAEEQVKDHLFQAVVRSMVDIAIREERDAQLAADRRKEPEIRAPEDVTSPKGEA